MKVHDLTTPCLLIDIDALDHNIEAVGRVLPGPRLRPHVKAFKSTAVARRLAEAGHRGFCCATTKEMTGLAAAGLGDDLLLANEVLDPGHLATLSGLARAGRARVTIAVDGDETLDAAAAAGVPEVLIDVDVGLPRCGCRPDDAGRLADRARSRGLEVRGVMGYEGHVTVIEDRDERAVEVERSMQRLRRAHEQVSGDVISAGSTVDFDQNTWATEIQAGSFVLMDTAFGALDLPFRQGLFLWTTVLSVSDGWAVNDGGLKSLGMDHGPPSMEHADVFICSDEHITFVPTRAHPVRVGEKVRVLPAHIDPTVARHEWLHVVRGADVVDRWRVDLRHW
jgi:D-serine deaminase-like pyridoxal phosphate-dependent protein